jgi:hypothetical protein
MSTERCVRWEPLENIQSACADISLSLDQQDRLLARMHFSSMIGQPSRDLLLSFSGLISLRWEQEHMGLNPLPQPLPQIGKGEHSNWTFPLLEVENSTWLAACEAHMPSPRDWPRTHFALISLNDLVQVLALPEVKAEWIDLTAQ